MTSSSFLFLKKMWKKIAKKLQKICKKIAKNLQKNRKKIAKCAKKNFLLCKIFVKFLQILNLHTDFRPREEFVSDTLCGVSSLLVYLLYTYILKMDNICKNTANDWFLHKRRCTTYYKRLQSCPFPENCLGVSLKDMNFFGKVSITIMSKSQLHICCGGVRCCWCWM